MSLVNSIKEWWRKHHPKTLEDIDIDEVGFNGIISPFKVVKIHEQDSGMKFKYKDYRDSGQEGPYFVCLDCNKEHSVNGGFRYDACTCGKRIAPTTEYGKHVIKQAVGKIMVYFSGP